MCGCGGKGGWFNPPEFVFHADCCWHDQMYDTGGSPAARKLADRRFLQLMLQSAEQHANQRGLFGLDTWSYKLSAWVYYRAVRLFGGAYFAYDHG